MVENIVVTKQGSESSDQNRTIFESSAEWSTGGSNLIVYKNGVLQERSNHYSVIDNTTIQLSSSASINDRISLVVTKFLDPSGLTTLDQRVVDLDRVSKKIENKAQTSIEKRDYEEVVPSSFIIHSDEIWSSEINPNPSLAEMAGVALKKFNLTLKEDFTVADHKGWYATINNQMSGRIINWIPPKFGQSYHVRLYDNNGIEIPSSSQINWKWDYQSGYLFIANDHSHITPFKISGYVYTGTLGSGNLMYWKDPVYNYSLLPIYNNQDGDIRFVTSEGKFYSWSSIETEWQAIEYGSARFKDPVSNQSLLPTTNNHDGDIRLTLDTNTLYRWNGISTQWEQISGAGVPGSNYYTKTEIDALLANKSDTWHSHDTIYYRKIEVDQKVRWRPSRATQSDLPPYTENIDGDVILTRDDNTIWRWYTDDVNTGQGHWAPILTSNYWWLAPVETHADLPTINNQPGHVRLVKDEGIAYYWDGTGWIQLTASADNHEHDDRYYTKDETYWLMPVSDFTSLPITNNKEGDVRLTLDDNNTYRWDSINGEWVLFSAAVNWRESIDYISNLPITDNRDRDIRFVNETESFYYWDDNTDTWKTIQAGDHNHDDRYYLKSEVDDFFDISIGHDHDGVDSKKIDYNNLLNIPYFYWKSPVVFLTDLPSSGNTTGDARIVLDERNIYVWDGSSWQLVSQGNFYAHNHDDRYYTETEIDTLINTLIVQFNAQLALKADINHHHDDRYYTEDEIDDMFDIYSGHDHDGINSKKISYYDLEDVPDFSQTHNHDDRYYTQTELQTSGQAQVHWDNITNAPVFGTFKTPVQTIADLPLTGNTIGDIRLVLDDSDLYEWDGSQWVFVGSWTLPGPDFWEAPVNEYINLPLSGNQNGDVRLVLNENTLYRWDSALNTWVDLSCNCEGIAVAENIQVYLNGLNLKILEEWNLNENEIVLSYPTESGDTVTVVIINNSTVRRYNFTAVGGQTIFTFGTSYYRRDFELSAPQATFQLDITYVPGDNQLLVFLNGVIQRVNEDYIEPTNDSIEFIEPCKIDDRIIVIILGYHLGAGTYIREDHNAVLGQTQYTLLNTYEVGSNNLFVYLNGALQREGEDYIEISSNTIELLRVSEADDRLTFIIIEGTGLGLGCGCDDACQINLGIPSDGSWGDGLLPFTDDYKTCDAIDDINEVLKDIAPEPPESLMGQELIAQGLNFHSGYTSHGNVNYETQAGDYHDYLTEDSTFHLFTPQGSFSDADKGVLKLKINGTEVDSFNLYNAFDVSNVAGIQGTSYGVQSAGARSNEGVSGTDGALRNSSLGYISIMSVEAFNGFKLWQKGEARLNIVAPILRQGYNTIQLVHELSSQLRTSLVVKLFYDIANSRPWIQTDHSFVNISTISNKYVSGVRYYSIGDQFETTLTARSVFNNTYVEYPLKLDMPGLKPLEIEWNHSDISGISDPPAITEEMNLTTNITLNEWNEYSTNARLEMIGRDPFGDGNPEYSVSVNRLVNTYTNGSTDLIEYFRDELYRLTPSNHDVIPLPRTGNWNSQNLLSNGDALLFDKKLQYANINFTVGYKPSPQTADYSAFSGPQTYYRSFYKQTARNSGKLILRGITQNDLLTNKIFIDIKLPTVSGWLSFNSYYDETTFDGVDGDGCFLNVTNTEEFNYSTGILSTANSGYTVVIRITLPDNFAPQLEYMEMVWE